MSKQQIENKIEDLKFWLTHNADHADRGLILKQKRDLEAELAELEKQENETTKKDIKAGRGQAR